MLGLFVHQKRCKIVSRALSDILCIPMSCPKGPLRVPKGPLRIPWGSPGDPLGIPWGVAGSLWDICWLHFMHVGPKKVIQN